MDSLEDVVNNYIQADRGLRQVFKLESDFPIEFSLDYYFINNDEGNIFEFSTNEDELIEGNGNCYSFESIWGIEEIGSYLVVHATTEGTFNDSAYYIFKSSKEIEDYVY